MSYQRFTYTERLEVGVSTAQADGTQGLIPLTVIKVSIRIITGDAEGMWKEGRKRIINLILGEVWRLQQTWVIPTHFSRASNCISKQYRAGMLGFSTGLRLPFLAVLFGWSPRGCWLMTTSTPLEIWEWLGIWNGCRLLALPKERYGKRRSVIWFRWGKTKVKEEKPIKENSVMRIWATPNSATCPQG